MPTYEHLCKNCNKEFEDFYSIKAEPPNICPLCNAKGKVVRLISAVAGRVELGHAEFRQKAKEDATSLRREMRKNENLRANIVGETAYHQMKLRDDKN
jgi:putative FmdB family regulatory protein